LVTYALNAPNAIERLKDRIPDIIISDVMMPEMDGIAFCETVKKNPKTRHIPIILLTAKNTDADMLKGVKAGADHYISKPFSIEFLESKIENVLKGMKTLRSNVIQDLPVDLDKFEYDSPDARFVRGLYVLVEENLSNPDLEVNFIAKKMGMSRAQLYRKVDVLCGQSVKEFVRTIRLKVAAKLLEKGDLRVSEIMYEVGINNRPYFIKRFKELYDTTPSEYMKKHKLVGKQ
jgi:YesN/AraC family two-component response regulator